MLDGYFRLQKIDTAISCVTHSLITLKNIYKLMQLITSGTALKDTFTFCIYTKFHIPDISGSSLQSAHKLNADFEWPQCCITVH
jgi:hypothetical protein